MNSKVLMVFAGLLLVGAVVVGYLGLSIGKPQAPVVSAQPSAVELPAQVDKLQRTPVVVVTRDLPALAVLGKDDLRLEYLQTPPAGSFAKLDSLLGQRVWLAVPAGSILSGAVLEPGGPLARTIRPDERAMAIAVDDVVGGGGFVLPGDYVDVMLYVADQQGMERNLSAQVVLPGVRVLTYGEQIAVAQDGQARDDKAKDGERKVARTAVLAVPADATARLMLASQAGSLRLAIRSKDENLYEKEQQGHYLRASLDASGSEAISLDQLLGRRAPAAAAAQPASRRQVGPAVGAGVVVYRGSTVTHEAP
ncbi:Flp pilus assembly protein CpaB [Pseudomonas citronellolis]|uniref:Flp pilus assembly protein CpaB n=1 Tax=Pseudomonas citronellolis TaxID=53408 RepID=UPI0023E4411F|nr:Flp pilus assembly protein CpaB [Pseudomonas citronellolis]MDF3932642.1 Flp pilus assembly protein CpaB [Pseudomonas citronellolis]